jgi:hypothetical protein
VLKDSVRTYWPQLVAFLAISHVVLAFALFVVGWLFINVRYMLVLSILMAIAQAGLLVTFTYQIKKEGWREAVAFVERQPVPRIGF